MSLDLAARIEQIRDLHSAIEDYGGELICSGCEVSGYDADPIPWPCATADLVYTAEEIAEVAAVDRARQARQRELTLSARAAAEARRSQGRETLQDQMTRLMTETLDRMLTRSVGGNPNDVVTIPIFRNAPRHAAP